MKHWTHTGAHVAGFLLLVVSTGSLFFGHGWRAVAGIGLAVALLSVLRTVEHFADVRRAADVAGEVEALKAKVTALEEAQKKTDEGVRTAMAGVLEAKQRRPATGGY